MTPLFVSIDIGGTKIAGALVQHGGSVLRSTRMPTPRGAEAVLDAVAQLVAQLVDRLVGAAPDRGAVAGVGVGAPGVIDPANGTVISATDVLPGWAGTRVRDGLVARTGLPVAVDNDVRVMALGELSAGAARGLDTALFVSVGTGIGGALAVGGRVRRGAHGTAGDLAHLPAGEAGAGRCGCGARDHVEAVASGPAIQAAGGTDALPHAGRVLGRALAGLIVAVDPDAVVVGGGVAQSGDAFLGPLTDAVHAGVLPPLRELPVRRAALGTQAPLIGAAVLAAQAAQTASPGARR